MAYFQDGSPKMAELEQMCADVGMTNVFYALESIARRKGNAESDKYLANAWLETATKIKVFCQETFHFHHN